MAAMLMKFLAEFSDRALVSEPDSSSGRTIIKSTSTPASLQAIVKVHGGNNGSLHHKVSTVPPNGGVFNAQIREPPQLRNGENGTINSFAPAVYRLRSFPTPVVT